MTFQNFLASSVGLVNKKRNYWFKQDKHVNSDEMHVIDQNTKINPKYRMQKRNNTNLWISSSITILGFCFLSYLPCSDTQIFPLLYRLLTQKISLDLFWWSWFSLLSSILCVVQYPVFSIFFIADAWSNTSLDVCLYN
jgi:hypothetical protein